MAERRAHRSNHRETGGLLLGFRSEHDVYVVDIIEVRDPSATRTRFSSPRSGGKRLFRATSRRSRLTPRLATWARGTAIQLMSDPLGETGRPSAWMPSGRRT